MEKSLTATERLAAWLADLDKSTLPRHVVEAANKVVLDIAGLTISARNEAYTDAVLDSWEGAGGCTVLGRERTLDPAGAALVNGTMAHGEDFDDTFEGSPLHAGAAAVPAVLAVCERHGRGGPDVLRGIAAAIETMARLALVSPGSIHKAGFQPASVIGCVGAAAGVGAALGFGRQQFVDALGIAGSFSFGLMEFLAEGAWTKRIHPGWAGHAGIRAAMLASKGFVGPRTMLEGRNGFYRAFARVEEPDTTAVTAGLGETWYMTNIAFKAYPCGTMIGPYIDCAKMARESGVEPSDIVRIDCRVAQAVAVRQWEPVETKRRPATGFAAKFSAQFGIALGLVRGEAGLAEYTDANAADPELLAVAGKVHFEIDPANPFPEAYTGDMRVTLSSGEVREFHQPHLRGGRSAPLSREELLAKFHANIAHGGWPRERGERLAEFCQELFGLPDLSGLVAFRG